MTGGRTISDLESAATADEIVELEEAVQPSSAAEQADLSHLGPQGMVRRDMLHMLGGGAAALLLGLRMMRKQRPSDMNETELQEAMYVTLTFNRSGGKLSYKRQLPDGRKVASYKPSDKILGRTYSTVTLEDDEDKFATTRFPDKIGDGDRVQFGRVIKASTSAYDAGCDSDDSCGPGGKPIFKEVEIMGETIAVTPQMMFFERVEDSRGGYGYSLGVIIRNVVFICPIEWDELFTAMDRKRSQKVPLVSAVLFDTFSEGVPGAPQVDRPASLSQ